MGWVGVHRRTALGTLPCTLLVGSLSAYMVMAYKVMALIVMTLLVGSLSAGAVNCYNY